MDGLTSQDITAIRAICPDGVHLDVDLGKLSQWRIGGTAKLIVEPVNTEQLSTLLRFLYARKLRPVVIGLTSNLLFADEGLNAPCIRIGRAFAGSVVEGDEIVADAGVWVPRLALTAMRAGLAGIEHVCGIPGTLGGLICMNGGSQRKGIGTHVVAVESVAADGSLRQRWAEDCDFGYRTSVFQRVDEVVSRVRLRLEPGKTPAAIRSVMRSILADRRTKFPRKAPNCGSVFKSNPRMYAEIGPPGAAIERLGFKGRRIGGAQVSPQHANFIINTGGARAADVLQLVSLVRHEVQRITGYLMDVENLYVSCDGVMSPACPPFGASSNLQVQSESELR